jgi:RimJ/RimL family protein N-acetyltransferase
MHYIIETKRLGLRELTLEDTDFILHLLNSPGWIQFIGDRNVKTHQQAVNYLQQGPLQSYHENGFGLSLVEKKDDKTSIGMCGLLKRDSLANPDIGFAFLPDFQGQGYAFEIATATLAYATDRLSISKVWAITLANNLKSIRLLEKLGLRFLKTHRFADNKEELLVYSN